MLTIVRDTLVKEISRVKIPWNLCNQILKNIENFVFYPKLTFFVSLSNVW